MSRQIEHPAGSQQPLSSGEIHFLWWFIQGSIMDVDVRWKLRRGWGMCDRHTAAWLTVEAAFRRRFMHGPTVLYADLMQRAAEAFDIKGPRLPPRLMARLRPSGPCHLCGLDYGPDSVSAFPDHHTRTGGDLTNIRRLMEDTKSHWSKTVCGVCAGTTVQVRCRSHLCDDLERRGLNGLKCNREIVRHIAERITRYERSFIWEYRGTETAEDRSALISAAGWCGGWKGLVRICPI